MQRLLEYRANKPISTRECSRIAPPDHTTPWGVFGTGFYPVQWPPCSLRTERAVETCASSQNTNRVLRRCTVIDIGMTLHMISCFLSFMPYMQFCSPRRHARPDLCMRAPIGMPCAWGVGTTQTGVAGVVWNRRFLAVPEPMRARVINACEHEQNACGICTLTLNESIRTPK